MPESTTLAAYALSIAALVAALISTIIKPLIETLPAFSSTAPDQRAHDALLRGINLLLNLAGVLILAHATGQDALDAWLPIALQVGLQALGAHALYQAVRPVALKAPAAPDLAATYGGMPNAAKQPGPDVAPMPTPAPDASAS